MTAECARTKLRFQGLDGRDVVGRFGGGEITSDAGGVLLREVEQRTRILGRLSECFTDYRDPDRVEHPVEALIKQRVLGLCLGYFRLPSVTRSLSSILLSPFEFPPSSQRTRGGRGNKEGEVNRMQGFHLSPVL